MIKPILSICIPTYNRANWLRSSLWNWLPQVKQANGLVELIVCDNASPDNTKQVIEEAREWGDFQYHCNSENIGILKNIYRLVQDLAKGEFVWVVGDDDLPSLDALQRIIPVLKNCSDINYIYVNYSYWHPSKEKQNELLETKNLDFTHTFSPDSQTRLVDKLAELVVIDPNCFTPVYCSIMRKQVACNAFELGILDSFFSSIETAIPHAVYIVKNLLNQNVWYIGSPCILASHDISWSKFSTLYWVDYIPKLYNLIKQNGGKKSDLRLNKKKYMSFIPTLVNQFRSSNKSIRDNLYITFKCYINYPISLILVNDIKYIYTLIKMKGSKIKMRIKTIF